MRQQPVISTEATTESSFTTTAEPRAKHVFPSPVITQHRSPSPPPSPWHSPVPYLFGGLAAMLGLIAFALLLLACSYWKLSTRSSSDGDGDIETGGEKQIDSGEKTVSTVYEDKILVIMAGDEKPTFLATPVSGKTWTNVVSGKTVNAESKEGYKGEDGQEENQIPIRTVYSLEENQ